MKTKIKAFLTGLDYAVKNYDIIQDHHFQSYPGATWHDKKTQQIYRRSIRIGRKYMQYRYEILASTLIFVGIAVLLTI